MHFNIEDVPDLFLARAPSDTALMPFQRDRDSEDRKCRHGKIGDRGGNEEREGDV